jgi:membrane-bound ClpP family serine protease
MICLKIGKMRSSKTRSTRTYILFELGELVVIVILLIVISRFVRIPLWLAAAIPGGKFLKFIIVYPFVRRSVRQPPYSGIESLIGVRARAIREIDPEGYVNVRGERWKAVTADMAIPAGTEVEVCGLDKAKLIVRDEGHQKVMQQAKEGK